MRPISASIDWADLRQRARELTTKAYVPYSHFPVGAAALVDDGRIVTGCNVENAAYGVALCAECGLISELVASGGGRLVAFSCANALGEQLMPCGRCRQLLWEHGGPELLVDTPAGVLAMAEVLPQAFGLEDIEHVTLRQAQGSSAVTPAEPVEAPGSRTMAEPVEASDDPSTSSGIVE